MYIPPSSFLSAADLLRAAAKRIRDRAGLSPEQTNRARDFDLLAIELENR